MEIVDKNLDVLILNDLCCYGKASLTVNIPVLSHFGIKVSPIPTMLLSNHTQFESFCSFDLTEKLILIFEELKKRNPKFNAIYIGWLSSEKQADIAIDIIKTFNTNLVILDPILGDNGKLYGPISETHINAMRKLIKHANIITPNITEAAALLGYELNINPDENTAKDWALKLSDMGPKSIVITSIEKDNKIGSMYYQKDEISEIFYHNKIQLSIPGTGDAFGSALLGYILNGYSIKEAVKKATTFVYMAVENAVKDKDNTMYGIAIEKRLNLL